MSKETTNEAIFQAVMELSEQLKEQSQKLDKHSQQLKEQSQKLDEHSQQIKGVSQQLTDTEKRLNEKIDIVDAKVTVLSESLLKTQAEVKMLKSAK